jgi:hypothetical protein
MNPSTMVTSPIQGSPSPEVLRFGVFMEFHQQKNMTHPQTSEKKLIDK